jgi:hypothetical protein
MKPATHIASGMLALVSIAHLMRLVFGVEITAAGRDVPMWISILGAAFPAAIAAGLWREART